MIGLFVRRPVLVAMILAGLCLLGALSFTQLPMELLPQTELPRAVVTLRSVQTADPAYVEKHAVIPMESAIAELDKIERIETRIDSKRATIYVYYGKSVNLKYAYLKLQRCIAAVRAQIGDEFTASVSKSDSEQLSNRFLVFQARGEGNLDQIRAVVDEKIMPELTTIDGIASAEVYGGRSRSVEVRLDTEAMKSYGLTVGQVASKISEQSEKRLYLGQAEEGRKNYFVNLVSEYTALPDIGGLILKTPGPVLLRHIADISEGGAEQTTISRINGQEAVSISLQRSWEANLINLARRTRRVISELDAKVKGEGITLAVELDEARTIEDNIQSIIWLAFAGGLLAVAVLWVFLKTPSLVLTVSASVPISILISMNVFYALHISINTLTMIGLAIAMGMLVDSSVVILENTVRHAALTADVKQAVIRGTNEVARAIVASTLTTTAVFVPFLFAKNAEIRTLGWQVGASIITALLVSLAVAFMLIPVLSYQFLSRSRKARAVAPEAGNPLGRMRQIYLVLLKTCLRYPARTIVVTVALFFVSLALCLTLSVNVPTEAELTQFNIYASMSSGTTLESADEQVKAMDALLRDVPEISERLATIEEDSVVLTFKLAEDFEKKAGRSVSAVKEDIIDRLSRANPRVEFSTTEPQGNSRFMGGSGGGGAQPGGNLTRLLGVGTAQEKVIVRGQDFELLRAVAEDVQYNIGNLDTVRSASVNVSNQQPSVDLILDQASLSHFDVSLQTVREELSGLQRQTSAGIKFKAGNEEINVYLKTEEEADKTIEDVRRLQFPSASGGIVPPASVARLLYSSGYANINRVNQEKQVEVTYRFESEVEESKSLLEQARASVEEIVAGIVPPPGIIIEVRPDETDISEFYGLILLGVILIYMILSSTFESFRTPVIMMFTLPLAGIGAFSGLILTGNSLYNANVLVGFLILFGVVVNNGVLLIDYARRLERKGQRSQRALMTAGMTRVRPILITAITTILGMLPVAMGKSEYLSLVGAPFAITVIGGLAVATLFTLVLVPTVSFGLGNALAWWLGLPLKTKLVQAAVLALGEWALLSSVESVLWQAAYSLILLLGIPAFTYFALTSLRRSRATLMAPGTPITITIRNISMLYDDFARFTKEWKKGEIERERRGTGHPMELRERRQSLVWRIPVQTFLFYFTYVYLRGNAGLLPFAVLFYLLTLGILGTLARLRPGGASDSRRGLLGIVRAAVYWGLPLANALWLQTRWRRWEAVAFVSVIWYAALLVDRTSRGLAERKVNIHRLQGRWQKPRLAFYRFVRRIPFIGLKREPFPALDRVNIQFGSGMFGLVGPNGSGKTTLMRILTGILPPTRGRVYINGLDLERYREELQALIGYLPQEFGAYENMTALQFLDYQALLKGIGDEKKRRAAVETALRSVHLLDRGNDRIKSYSGGMKQRLGIAQTLLHLPRVLVVDEPTAGLDPTERIKFRNLLSELARDRTVIFSTHIIEDIASTCNRLAVLLKGGVRFVGTPAELVDLTRGAVWEVTLDDSGFESLRRMHKVIHHLRDGDRIRARVLSPEKPHEEARPVDPTLEDSYMWLLGQEGLGR
ncbi:MAG: hypothetical protein A2Y86_00560 [Candidatus Aminicenantes bacterium RBG_13_62_12]|nr:MAG: hypothetical protein A2Y86_00560 [Candidatus Aminicenantes bacterium RBG_13_62_12]